MPYDLFINMLKKKLYISKIPGDILSSRTLINVDLGCLVYVQMFAFVRVEDGQDVLQLVLHRVARLHRVASCYTSKTMLNVVV